MKCMHCELEATYTDSKRRFCDMHYRFNQMRQDSKSRNKYKPTKEELFYLVPKDMKCVLCKTDMIWRRKFNQKGLNNQITLQHWADGSLGLICLSCNTRHASMPEDSFKYMDTNDKFCPGCKQIKHKSNFSVKNSRSVLKRNSSCLKCSAEKSKMWRQANKEKYNAYQREYRLKMKLSSNLGEINEQTS